VTGLAKVLTHPGQSGPFSSETKGGGDGIEMSKPSEITTLGELLLLAVSLRVFDFVDSKRVLIREIFDVHTDFQHALFSSQCLHRLDL
jgi:hypothetical protein